MALASGRRVRESGPFLRVMACIFLFIEHILSFKNIEKAIIELSMAISDCFSYPDHYSPSFFNNLNSGQHRAICGL